MIHRLFLWGMKFSIGLAILFFLLYYIGFDKIAYALASANFSLLPAVFLGIMLLTLLYPLSLVILYNPLKTKEVSVGKFFKLRLWTQIIGNITPNKIGEVYLIFLLKRRYKMNATLMFYIFAFDKITSILHALIFATIGFLFLFRDTQKSTLLAIITFGIIIGIAVFYYGLKKLQKFPWKALRMQNLSTFLGGFVEFFQDFLKKQRKYIAYSLFFTFVASVFTAIIGKITFLALNTNIPFLTVFFVTNMIAVAAVVPLNVLGIGIKELSSIYFYSLIGVSPSITAATIIILTLSKYIVYGTLYVVIELVEIFRVEQH